MDPEDLYSLTCPCCGSVLTVDAGARVVLRHTMPKEEGSKASFESRMSALKEEKRLAEDKFKESIRAEKSKKEVLEKKFKDLFEKAKEGPVGPMKRDIDLD